MLFISAEDFIARTSAIPRLSRSEEKALAQRMAAGDRTARESLVRSHLPLAAALIRRAPKKVRTLRTVYACIETTEKAVDQFHFLQDSEPFVHHLGWRLRQCIARCLTTQDEH